MNANTPGATPELLRQKEEENKAIEKKWSELLPQNDKIIVNGTTYVHWYDCITDYIL